MQKFVAYLHLIISGVFSWCCFADNNISFRVFIPDPVDHLNDIFSDINTGFIVNVICATCDDDSPYADTPHIVQVRTQLTNSIAGLPVDIIQMYGSTELLTVQPLSVGIG